MPLDGTDKLNRLLNNFWTAVFEQPGQKKQNRPLRDALTVIETATVITDPDSRLSGVIPPAYYYAADLVTPTQTEFTFDSGYAGSGVINGTKGIHSAYAQTLCDETQMWFSVCLKPTWAYNAAPSATPYVFSWYDDANNWIVCYYDQATNKWTLGRRNVTNQTVVQVNGSHAAYDIIVLTFYVTATEIGLSLNGAAPTKNTGTQYIPTLASANYHLCNAVSGGGSPITATLHWFAMGLGVVTDSDIAALATRNQALGAGYMPFLFYYPPSLGFDPAQAATGWEYWQLPDTGMDPRLLWGAPFSANIGTVPTACYGDCVYG